MRTLSVAVLLLALGCASPPAPESTPGNSDAPLGERDRFLDRIARGYYPGRSGQIFFVPEPGEVFLRKPMGLYRFMHGSPWDYDAHIPLIFYGPAHVPSAVRADEAHQQDVAPTLLASAGFRAMHSMTGRDLAVGAPDVGVPKAVAIFVLDGMRADYLERYADALPVLTKLGTEGAYFENARVNFVPSVTSAGHTTIATGTDPAVHGIAGNGYYDRAVERTRTLFEGLSPGNIMTLGIADLWSLETNAQGIVVAQGTTPRATVSLGGHGACMPNGHPAVLAMFDYRQEGFVTNPDCFTLPDYLGELDARGVWEEAGSVWRGFEIEDGRDFVTTGLFPGFQAEALIQLIEREGVGKDDVPDLVLVNFKTPDYVGHYFGPDANEMKEALRALDEALGNIVATLDRATGGDFVLAVSADHGMPSEPDGTDAERRFIREVVQTIHGALDPEEGRLLFEYLDTANNQFYVDRERMKELGLTLSDIAVFVEDISWIRAAFTEDEVAGYENH